MRPRNKRILSWAGLILLGIVAVFIVIQALLHFGDITAALGGVVAALRAIIVGCVLAYLLYPLARFAEQFLLYHKVKKKAARTLSTFFALLILLLLLLMFAYFIIPQLVVSLPPLMQNLPSMIESFDSQITQFLTEHGVSTDVVSDLFQRVEDFLKGWLQDDPLATLAEVLTRAKNAAQGVLHFIIGIIVMVYVLLGRDQFVGQGKKLLYASVKRRSTCDAILYHLRNINKIFSGFVSGKLLDSLIIGIICGVVLSILRMPYTPLISVVVGVTNIVPVFGPFFGAIPSALLLLLTDPGKCVIFLIFMFSISRMKDIQRTFEYHGAEHKSIACYESGADLTVENARKCKKEHPRCGTSFLLVVMIISILVFSVVRWSNPLIRLVLRLALLPVVVGISYEINRAVGRHDNAFTMILRQPGLWLQHLTTREPDDSMLEVAITALKAVIPQEKGADRW